MITTTLNRIREQSPCVEGWKKLLAHLDKTQADDEPLPFSTILDAIGLEDTLSCLRAEPQHNREWRLFSVWCARQVQHLMTDTRSIAAIDMAERYAHGEATDEELRVSEVAAWDAALLAAAMAVAGDMSVRWAARAAMVAAEAAERVCDVAAKDAAAFAAWTAAGEPRAGRAAALEAAWSAQEAELRRIVG